MTNCVFAHGWVGVTVDMKVRFWHPVVVGRPTLVRLARRGTIARLLPHGRSCPGRTDRRYRSGSLHEQTGKVLVRDVEARKVSRTSTAVTTPEAADGNSCHADVRHGRRRPRSRASASATRVSRNSACLELAR